MAFSPDLNQTLVSSLNLIPTSEYGPLSFTADDYWRAVINIIINIDINIVVAHQGVSILWAPDHPDYLTT